MRKVAVIMGSKSDLPVVEKAVGLLDSFGVPYTVRVLSAHRCPDEAKAFAKSAANENYGVLIAAAGMAAHLAGALAANTTLPVIGILLRAAGSDGADALLSTVMMPPGIPVATVGIDGAKNAALLAVEILAVSDAALAEKLADFRKADTEKTLAADAEVRARFEKGSID